MAIKKRDVEEKSKLIDVLKNDYRWENLLLGLVAIFATALSVMIINKSLTISPDFPVLGQGSNGLIFAWILLVISVLGIILVIFPYIYASLPEVKRISWSHGKEYLDNTIRTFIFVISLTLVLFLFDVLIKVTIGRIV